MALSLDVTCIASAYLIGHSSLIFTTFSPEERRFERGFAWQPHKFTQRHDWSTVSVREQLWGVSHQPRVRY